MIAFAWTINTIIIKLKVAAEIQAHHMLTYLIADKELLLEMETGSCTKRLQYSVLFQGNREGKTFPRYKKWSSLFDDCILFSVQTRENLIGLQIFFTAAN